MFEFCYRVLGMSLYLSASTLIFIEIIALELGFVVPSMSHNLVD